MALMTSPVGTMLSMSKLQLVGYRKQQQYGNNSSRTRYTNSKKDLPKLCFS